MCSSGTANQFSLYNICNFCVCIVYTYVCHVLVYFVLYVYNCMHKRTIKYLVSCILLVATIDAPWEGMGDVGSARYEPALLPPCPTIRVLNYSN